VHVDRTVRDVGGDAEVDLADSGNEGGSGSGVLHLERNVDFSSEGNPDCVDGLDSKRESVSRQGEADQRAVGLGGCNGAEPGGVDGDD
jgi:hypothetical protein